MKSDPVFDYATPFDVMCGVWSGMATLFNGKGDFLSLTPSMVSIYWKQKATVLSYRQIEQPFSTSNTLSVKAVPQLPKIDDALGINPALAAMQSTNLHFDLQVQGKYCKSAALSGPGLQNVEGTETTPGIYIFHLGFQGGRYYNNQYFIDPNERHIIGPYIRDGSPQVAFVVAQAFTRVSYDVPPSARSELPPS
jgi:hypothetical protein